MRAFEEELKELDAIESRAAELFRAKQKAAAENLSGAPVEAEEAPPPPVLSVVPVEDFAAEQEASAEPLLGDRETTALAAGGDLMAYGDGGAGKTTLQLDACIHIATGTDWIGLPVPRPVRVMVIENEGPRGKLREKLAAKLAAWKGPSVDGRLLVLEEPWAMFTFAEEATRAALVAVVEEHEIELIAAGPVARLGMKGGGTQDEIAAFMDTIALVRRDLARPLAVWLTHHENNAGDVSGAWEGFPDTLLHVQAQGKGRTRVHWRKVRWGSELHQTTWKLLWAPGETYELDETPELTDDEVEDSIVRVVGENPGIGSTDLENATPGVSRQRRRAVRDRLLIDSVIVNVGKDKDGNEVLLDHIPPKRAAHLYIASDPTIFHLRPDPGAVGAQSAPAPGGGGTEHLRRAPRPIRGAEAQAQSIHPYEEQAHDQGAFTLEEQEDEQQ